MEDVTITGMELVRELRISKQGHVILAHFSADIGVFAFKGCVLVRTARQGIGAWLPRLEDPRSARLRSVTLNSEPTRNALLKAAREMYIAMGGKDAEWRSRDGDQMGYSEPSERKPLGIVVGVTKRRIERAETDDRAGLETFLRSNETGEAQADGGE